MRESIPQNDDNYRLLKLEQFRETNSACLESFTTKEQERIEKLRKKINSKKRQGGITSMAFGAFFTAISVINISEMPKDEFIVFISVGLLTLLVGVFWLLSIIPKKYDIYACYGIANGKFSMSSGNNRDSRRYYIDVIFPNTNTRYKQTECSYQDFEEVEKGDKVLVAIFKTGFFNKNKIYSILSVDDYCSLTKKDLLKIEAVTIEQLNLQEQEKITKLKSKINNKLKKGKNLVYLGLIIFLGIELNIFLDLLIHNEVEITNYSLGFIISAIIALIGITQLLSKIPQQCNMYIRYGNINKIKNNYVDVVFQDGKTRNKDVICISDDCDNLEIGQKVLIIIFEARFINKNKMYCISLE